jgi:hypothetical protein
MLRLILTTLFASFLSVAVGQFMLTPINPEQSALVDAYIAKSDQRSDFGVEPYLLEMKLLDSIFDADTKNWERREYNSWVMRKLKNEHLIEVHSDDFHLQGDAAFNLEGSNYLDAQGRRAYTNTRGYVFNGTIGKRIFFHTTFFENQSIFPNYMDSVVSDRGEFNEKGGSNFLSRGSVPGYGRWKSFTRYKSSYDYDYTLATGSFGVVLNRHSYLQFGHEKQFVGHGHRSLLLSDASSPFPFLKAQIGFWDNRITYTTTYAVLQSLERISDKGYANKENTFKRLGARFSYLSFQPSGWFSFGLFDGTTWTWRKNSSPGSIEYYSPHGWLYTGNGIRNHITGLNGQVTLFKMLQGYGQYALNIKGSGQAAQVGLRLFGPIRNMNLRIEYNKVGQGFYFYAEDSTNTILIDEPLQSGTNALDYYQHNDLMLGHPIGVALDEFILKMNYRLRDVFANTSVNYIKLNSVSNPKTILNINVEAGYIINPKSNAQIVAGVIYRTETGPGSPELSTNYPYIAFRTNLFNRYMDF